VAGLPVGELLGGVSRKEIPVYLSGSARELNAEDEVAIYVQGLAETGARAVKFKIGGRMSRNLDTYPGRTEKLVTLAREKLGAGTTLMADANGSYDVANGIRTGRLLESLGFAFYEEPCPFEELSETQAVSRPCASRSHSASRTTASGSSTGCCATASWTSPSPTSITTAA
jgi:L-alanine-DL-glutamate epimerase-like enolase superfamily enzyme